MSRRHRPAGRAGLALALAPLLALAGCAPGRPAPRAVTVFAAASLADAFADVARDFERSHPGVRVRVNAAGSQQLAAQIEQGARADVFASADERWMQALAARGRLATPARLFAGNRLAVITPADNPAGLADAWDLARPGVRLVLAADAVPAGRYARRVLARLGAEPGAPAGYERRVLANVASDEENVRAVVGKVALGEADAGIVYASDAGGAMAPRLRVLDLPPAAQVHARYPVAVLAGAPAPALARAFVDALLAPGGQATLVRHGFLPVRVVDAR